MLRNVCANTPLYKVSVVFEDLLGQSVTEGDEIRWQGVEGRGQEIY